MNKGKALFAVLATLFILSAGCSNSRGTRKVSLEKNLEAQSSSVERGGQRPLQFAIAAMVSPEETINSYKKIMDYIARRLGREYVLVQKDTYGQVNDLFRSGAIDIAFVCSGAYVELSQKADPEILAVPVVNGKTVYYSYIIVPADSGASHFDELRGGTFAFVDPLSNTGFYYPMSLVIQKGAVGYNEYFTNVVFTSSHSSSVAMTGDGNVGGAAVDSLIFDFMVKRRTSLRENIRIIKKSPPYAMPPFIVHSKMPSRLKKDIRNILLRMDEDEEGARILSELNIDKFSRKADEDYDSIRDLYELIQGNAEVK